MKVASTDKPKTLKQQELLNTQLNAQETENKSNSICETRKIAESPFTIVKRNDLEEDEFNCFIAVGDSRLSGMMTEEECERIVAEKTWSMITQLIVLVTERVIKENLKTKTV